MQNEAPKDVKFKVATYKEIYDFDYSPSGMNGTSTSSKEFADLWSEKCASEPFAPFAEAFQFSYSASEMNMTTSNAREWAMGKMACLKNKGTVWLL